MATLVKLSISKQLLIFVASVLLITGLLFRLNEIYRPFWTDETISLNTLKINVLENPLFFGTTTNLPLYFWLIWIGDRVLNPPDPALLRLVGVLVNAANGIILFYWLKTRFSQFIALTFLAIFMLAPLQIHYSAELRPYALVQLLASLVFIKMLDLITTKDKVKTKPIIFMIIVATLGVLTHYAFYIFFFALVTCLLFYSNKRTTILKITIIPAMVGLGIIMIYQNNPLFIDSLEGMEMRRGSVSPLTRFLAVENITRVKEVLVNYYYYGLYYYRLDLWAQAILKKVLLILFAVSVMSPFIQTDKEKRRSAITTLMVLFASLFIALTGEKFGYYPFGGRHIMPFSFLTYIILGLGLDTIFKAGKVGRMLSSLTLVALLASFIAFQGCSQMFKSRYTGTGDPQGDIYSYCSGSFSK